MAKNKNTSNKKKAFASAYDKIWKENILETLKPFLKENLGIDIDNNKIEYIVPKLQKTLEVEADFLGKVIHNDSQKDYVLHLEFQTSDNMSMHLRMNLYQAFVRFEHNICIKQYVIYLGKGESKMPTSIIDGKNHFEYELINFETLDIDNFINSSVPEQIILGILADYKGEKPEKIVDKIIEKILSTPTEIHRKQKCVVQLEILSNLRDLQNIIQQKNKNMAFEYDLKSDIRFKQGVEEGRKMSSLEVEKAAEKLEKAKQAAEKLLISNVLEMHKSNVKNDLIARYLHISLEKVLEIINKNK